MSSITNIIGTSDFTIEFWINPVLDSNRYILTSGIFYTNQWYLYLLTTGAIQLFIYDYSPSSALLDTATNSILLSPNIWSFVALVRKGNKYTIYINGTSAVSIVATTPYNLNNYSSSIITIGSNIGVSGVGASYFNGQIDELRITLGIARYINNFNIPSSSFPSQSQPYNVNLLSQSQSTSINTTITTLSTNPTNIDNYYGNVVSLIRFDNSSFTDYSQYSIQPFNNNTIYNSSFSLSNGTISSGSGYFNGTSYLLYPSSLLPLLQNPGNRIFNVGTSSKSLQIQQIAYNIGSLIWSINTSSTYSSQTSLTISNYTIFISSSGLLIFPPSNSVNINQTIYVFVRNQIQQNLQTDTNINFFVIIQP